MGVRLIRRLVPLSALLIVIVSVVSAGAFGHGGSAPKVKVVGNAIAGKPLFTSAGCSSCHVLAAAKAKGKIGPSLDTETLTEAKIITQITNGGYAVMGIAAKKQYPFPMAGFKSRLTAAKIQDIAAFVFTKRTGAPAATTTTSSTTTTIKSSTTTTTISTSPATTTTKPVGDGCPAGTTIPTSGATDNDGDENGDPSDGDGCI